MSEKTIKIEIELDLNLKKAIEIIAQSFSWTPEQFILYSIKKDIEYVIGYTGLDDSYSEDLKEHYKIERIDMKQLWKLQSIEGLF